MDISPWSNPPVQLFVPAYVPWNCDIRSSMSNLPVAVAVQPLIIMGPDIVIVYVPVRPEMVPVIVPAVRPPMDHVPENVFPVWVTDQAAPPAIDADVPLPIIVPLESDALPTQFPDIVAADVGVMGEPIIPLLPPQAESATANPRVTIPNARMALPALCQDR